MVTSSSVLASLPVDNFSPFLDLVALQNAVAIEITAAIQPLAVAGGVDCAVLIYPQRPEQGQGQGDAGRPGSIYVGFADIERVDEQENETSFSHLREFTRSYEVGFNLVIELYDYVDQDDALRVISAVLNVTGVLLPFPGAKPLQLSVAFSEHEDGYFVYEGSITLLLDQKITISIAPERTKEYRIYKIDAGVFVLPVGAALPFDSDGALLDAQISASPTENS